MKKLLFILILTFSLGITAHAQDKDKVKNTSSTPQKVHNTFSKHKKHNGYKVKHRHSGVTHKHIVKNGEETDRIKK
jgi:ABC-type uncharacterized transport system YnjBCD substrate-binding protein